MAESRVETRVDSWEPDDNPPDIDTVYGWLVAKGIRETIIQRAMKRLDGVTFWEKDRTWSMPGIETLGDSFDEYLVRYNQQSHHYNCSCHNHLHGNFRERKFCSHVVVAMIHRRLNKIREEENRIKPSDLGLPVKFEKFRSVQAEALEKVRNTDAKYIFLQLPTGSGKSLLAAAIQKTFGVHTIYTCSTKNLQDQFINDFAIDGNDREYAVELKGRSNYPVLRPEYAKRFPKINAGLCTGNKEGHCRWCCDGNCGGAEIEDSHNSPDDDGLKKPKKTNCRKKRSCPYSVQKRKVVIIGKEGSIPIADLAVVNMSLLLNEANYVGGLSGWDLIVHDECDQLESELLNFIEFEITAAWIKKLGIEPPKRKTVKAAWLEWAEKEALPKIEIELRLLKEAYGVEDLKREQQLERMKSKMEFFLREAGKSDDSEYNWVFMPDKDKWVFKPVFVHRYAEEKLWQHANRFIFMSATILSLDEMCYSLGIPQDEAVLFDFPSSFPVENRPIFYHPSASLTNKTPEERPKAIRYLDRILDKYPDVKTLVHTVSYDLANQVMEESKHSDKMITYVNAVERSEILQLFTESDPGTVLVAPSMERGVDLKEDLARVVVVMKMPFLSLGDKQVAQRLYLGKKAGQRWYNVQTIRTLIQSSGRAVRSSEDWAHIYIIDAQFGRLYSQNKNIFPKYWIEAVKFI